MQGRQPDSHRGFNLGRIFLKNIDSLSRGRGIIYSYVSVDSDYERFILQCCKTRPDDPVVWLAHWLILNNPNKPKLPEDLALIPT
jgi:hypothetical protein